MKIYKLRCIKIIGSTMKEVERIFLSERTAQRYRRLFLWISNSNLTAAAIFPMEISAHGADMYVLTEDNHGEIGYFIDRDKAYEAARDVIMENPYVEHWDELTHRYIQEEFTRDEITDQQIDDYDFLVGVKRYRLNSAWCH